MKNNTKSSITLPPKELKLVTELQKKLHIKTKVEVIRRGLQKLKDDLDRNLLLKMYKEASAATNKFIDDEISELDHLASEGID